MVFILLLHVNLLLTHLPSFHYRDSKTVHLSYRLAFKSKGTWGQWALTNALLIVAMMILCIGIFVVFLLLSCHSYLMATGQTTWEYMSRSRISYLKIFAEGDNPFHEGICGNIYKFFCYFKPRRWEILLRKREDFA